MKNLVSLLLVLLSATTAVAHEAQAASKLHHSNIVTIYDAGERPEGCFIYMEYVHGESLRQQLDRDGSLKTLDGPFDAAPESIGGIYVVEADSIDEALGWARQARFMVGANEVREIWD